MSRSWPVLIFLCCVARASTQGTPLPLPEEAPKALFETSIGSSDVEMFLDGSWRAGATGATGFMIRSGEGILPLDVFPIIPLGFEFHQEPELTFSVWLQKHYFIEFTVLGSFSENAFRAGYQGEGILRSLVVGNRGIAIDPYPYLSVPETGDSSLGAEATLVSGESRHELLVRYDNNSSGRKVFVGENSVDEVRLPLSSYEQGIRLRLPDEQVDGLRVYLENPDGGLVGSDGRRYRLARTDDAVADAETGIVTLNAKPAGRVLAHYTRGAQTVGDVGLGIGAIASVAADGAVNPTPGSERDFNFTIGALWPGGPAASALEVTVDGRTALLLHERGVFSLFDMQGTYLPGVSLPEDSWRIKARLVERGGYDEAATRARLRIDSTLSRLVISLVDGPRDLQNLYPLLDEDSTGARLYGPFRDDSEGLFDTEILLETLTPVSGYFLEPDILSGSVSVTRNGAPETRFTVDTKTGQITFQTTIGPADRLEISYKRKGALLDNGDLVLAWGNRFALRDPFVAELAAGFRWNALPGAYSEKPFTRTGAVLLSAGVSGALDNLSLDVKTAVSYSHPDTTGRLRLAGMEQSGLDVSVDENLAVPASAPGGTATQANRGKLIYKDYRDYGPLGSVTLLGPQASIPSSHVYPYGTGSKIGPYNVDGGSTNDEDKSLVLDFDLDDDRWAGFQIPVLPGQPLADLSNLEALITSYRMLELTGTVDVSIQIGDVAEDVDEDGRLDEESSPSATGFLFNDTGNGVTLLVGNGPKGEGNGRVDTEDLDGDEHLQGVDGLSVVGETIAPVAGGWNVQTNRFDSDERRRLRRARAIRVFVRETTGAAARGRLLIDRFALAGSTFAVVERSDGADTTTAVREVAERFARDPPSRTLENAFKDVVKDVFHAGGEVQKVLEIETGTSQQWTVRGFTSAGTEGARYRAVVHYLRMPQWNAGQRISFELLDSAGKGIHWSFTPTASFSDWQEVRVDIDKKSLKLNDSTPSGASVAVDHHDSLVQFRIRSEALANDGSDALIYVDELHMASPEGSVGAAVAVDTELRVPGPLVRMGGVPIISDLRVREIASTVTPGFSPLYGRPEQAWGGSTRTEIGMGLPASRLDAHFVADWTDDEATVGGGHGLLTAVGPVSFSDTFDLRAPGHDATFDRESRLRLSPLPGTAADASVRAAADEDRLTQEWSGSLASAAGRWNASMVADFSLATLDYEHSERGYFDAWVMGYRFFAPQRAPLLERTSRATAEIGLLPGPVGLALRVEPSARSQDSDSGREQTNGLLARLAAPWEIGNRGTIITAAYQRQMETGETLPQQGDFRSDWSVFADDFARQSYAYLGVPLWELYDDNDSFLRESAEVTSAVYSPELQVEITRRPGSQIRHLFVPTKMLAVVGRTLERQGAITSDLSRYSLTYQTNAINLFGRSGSHPTFTFYDLDEFANSLTLSLNLDGGKRFDSGEVGLDTLVSMESSGGNQVSVSNRFSLTGESLETAANSSQASYTWYVRPSGGVRLPLLGEDITGQAFFVHDEALEITAASGERPLSALVRHRSEIRIPEHGHVAATLAIGADYETFRGSSGREWVLRLAFQAGIEALIRFGSGEPRRESTPAPRKAEPGRPP